MKRLCYTLIAFGCILNTAGYSADTSSKDSSSLNMDKGAQERLSRIRGMPEEPSIRILLLANQESVDIEVAGAHNIFNPKNGKTIETLFSNSSYAMMPSPEGLKWGTEFPGVFQMLIIPDSQETPVRVNGVEYPGVLICYQVGDKLAVVNQVSLEDFTSSLLSSTLLPKFHDTKETLAAYAIAFRTKGLAAAIHPKNTFWDAKASTFGYHGKSVMRRDKAFQDAIKGTRKLVVIGKDASALTSVGGDDQVAEILAAVPREEVVKLSKNGKNAKEILEFLFPDVVLTVAQKPNDDVKAYIK